MLTAGKLLLGLGVVVASAFLFRFGTLSPCGALKQEMKAQLASQALSGADRDKWAIAGRMLGLATAGPMIDGIVDGLDPIQCTQRLARLWTGEQPFSDLDTSTFTTTTAADVPPPAVWIAREEQSKIDDSTSVFLSRRANEPVTDWLQDQKRPYLMIRCQEGKTEALIDFDLQLDLNYTSDVGKRTAITLRYDKRPAVSPRMSLSTDDQAVFFPDPIPTVRTMLQSQTLAVQFTPYRQGKQTITFDLAGLKEEIFKVQKACKWK